MGCDSLVASIIGKISGGRDLASRSSASKSLNCDCVGNSPYNSRYAVSSNVDSSAKSWMLYPQYSKTPLSPSMNVVRVRSK